MMIIMAIIIKNGERAKCTCTNTPIACIDVMEDDGHEHWPLECIRRYTMAYITICAYVGMNIYKYKYLHTDGSSQSVCKKKDANVEGGNK